MTRRNGRIDRTLDRMMALDSPVYGDERERALFMESATFGMTVAIYVSLASALVAAVFGTLLLPVVLLVMAAVPSWATMYYAKRRGVDVNELVNRVSLRDKAGTLVVTFVGIVLVIGAMAYTIFTGHGLLRLPVLDLVGPDASGLGASLVRGGIIGAFGGAVVGLVAAAVGSRRRAGDDTADDDED